MSDRPPATIEKDSVLQDDTTKPVPTSKSRQRKPGRSRSRSIVPYDLDVIIDTREQRPFEFPDGVKTTVATLATGDYSVRGWTPFVAVERKSWADFYSCLTGTNRERFERELERLSGVSYPAVVVEAAFGDLWKPHIYRVRGGASRRSQVPPLVAQKSIIAWSWRYRIPFYFCGGRESAMKWTLLLLADAVRVMMREQKERNGRK